MRAKTRRLDEDHAVTPFDQSKQMTLAVHVVLLLLVAASCDDVLRPAAIIPWSQYQLRLKETKELSEPYYSEVPPEKWPLQRLPPGTGSRWLGVEKNRARLAKTDSTELNSRPKSVIRAQLRSRAPPEKESHSNSRLEYEQTMRKKEQLMSRSYQLQQLSGDRSSKRNLSLRPISIPNGVPVHAGTWENGRPNYVEEEASPSQYSGTFEPTQPKHEDQRRRYQAGTWQDGRATAEVQKPQLQTGTWQDGRPTAEAHKAQLQTGAWQDNRAAVESQKRPLQEGTWEEDRTNYEPQKRPQQHGAATLGAVNPLTSVAQNFGTPGLGGTEENIVNAIFAQSKAGALNPEIPLQAAQAARASPAGLNPLETLLSSGAPLDQITKIAHNILNFGGGEGTKGGLIESMTNVFRGAGARLPLPTSSFQDDLVPAGPAKPQQTIMEKLLTQAASALNHSFKDKDDKEKQFRLTKDREDSLKLLDNLPEEEQKLLKAAITSGELDADSLAPALKSLVKDDTKEDSKKEKESRLLEWIRENRPASKHKEATVSADKLPYYGKYCGSFAEQITAKKRFKPSGAVWVVDDKRFIISKFFFQPGSLLSENVTFWMGPLKQTDNVLADMFPSSNGFYVRPQPIEISVFALDQLPPMAAKRRNGSVAGNNLSDGTKPIEPIVAKAKKAEDSLRVKRDASLSLIKEASLTDEEGRPQVDLMVKDGVVHLNRTGLPSDFRSGEEDEFTPIGLSRAPFRTIGPAGYRIHQPEEDRINYSYAQPLEWFAGFQPLLLTLPDGILTKSVHWISLRDHRRHETVASVLLPNGPAFQIPSVVELRGLSPNGAYNISSGPIRVVDIKTIEISNFILRTEGKAVWFMIGKDILPNSNGHIVPLYDSSLKMFDCESLRDYHGESVHLRLPGSLDIKDVFWFSVFSMAEATSYSHIYLPFNDMQLPPDLNGVPTPSCKYTP